MKLHVLGISGTFMSGIAVLAKQAGHEVTGSDENVYPPMSTQLLQQGITLSEGYHPSHIPKDVDCVVVGNVIRRGNPAIEHVMSKRIPYISGPEWLYHHLLKDRWVIAVSGTHGKTTTTSMVAWILEHAGLAPGFLVGGIPENFGISAKIGKPPYFVIEADEYDSAFFDKRSKFLHYRPKTAILNNLEYDHADIFPNLDAIKQQFHFFIRTIPGDGLIIQKGEDTNLSEVIAKGCWTPIETFGVSKGDWQVKLIHPDGSAFSVLYQNQTRGTVNWSLLGQHNVENALAAISAAHHAGVMIEQSIEALASFKSVKRRLELKGIVKDVSIYDDFAHHPTAIATTLKGLRAKIGHARLVTVLEFGSYTMRTGVHKDQMREALALSDMVVCKSTHEDWGLETMLAGFKQPTALYKEVDALVLNLTPQLRAGDHVVIMSNSGFGGIHQKLINSLERG